MTSIELTFTDYCGWVTAIGCGFGIGIGIGVFGGIRLVFGVRCVLVFFFLFCWDGWCCWVVEFFERKKRERELKMLLIQKWFKVVAIIALFWSWLFSVGFNWSMVRIGFLDVVLVILVAQFDR